MVQLCVMRADRLLSLLMILQTNGQMTATALAKRLEVSVRTVYRDLDALSAAGVPVYTERGPGGGCALLEPYRTNLTGLKEDEVRALFSLTVSGLLKDLGHDKASKSAWLKLMAALPARLQQDARIVQQRFHMDPAGWFQPGEPVPHLSVVQECVWHSRRLRLQYRMASGVWIKRVVDPYGLVAKAGVWYLVAACFGRVRTYRVSRLQEAKALDTIFEYPPEFDLAAFWQVHSQRFEEELRACQVCVCVNPGGVKMLVESFGEGIYQLLNESWAKGDKGRLLYLSFPSRDVACRQLLGLGPTIEVVAPIELREEMRRIATRVAALYSEETQPRPS